MMKKTVFLSAAVILFCGALNAMDWPSQDAELVHNFGWNNRGEPVLGTAFRSSAFIQAADNGELLFTRRKGDAASRLPSPLGAWTALDHGDGIISIYSRYDDSRSYHISDTLSRGTPIAVSGKSGWASVSGFFFSLFDRRERRWVNPSMIISPMEDTQAPVIQSIQLTGSQGTIDLAQIRTLGQGRYTIEVAAADALGNKNEFSLAPHRIICSFNGTEAGSLLFETVSVRDGVQLMYRNGLTPVKQIYAPFPRYEVGEVWLTRGQATLEVIAGDIAGNNRSTLYRLQVE
ncbi:MAG: M23 family metallopeptidase [Treponema sp.]|jgi:hypothetical protein|nr:M23 family metallopeptidase [Treponema sp.]